jgi:hypothetical protein
MLAIRDIQGHDGPTSATPILPMPQSSGAPIPFGATRV